MLEFAVGSAQSVFRVDTEVPSEVDHGEQKVAQLVFKAAASASGAAISSLSSLISSSILPRTGAVSGQSKPMRAARF